MIVRSQDDFQIKKWGWCGGKNLIESMEPRTSSESKFNWLRKS